MIYRYSIAALGAAGAVLLAWRKQHKQKREHIRSFAIEPISQKENEITFKWTGGKDTYNLYREDEQIYSGADAEFTDTDLVPGKVYVYTVEEIHSDSRISNIIKIQTATAVKNKEAKNVLQDLVVTTMVTDSLIGIEWEPIEGVTEYAVYRNGKRVTKVQECRFVDYNVRNDEEYTYSIRAERPLALSEKKLSEERFAAAGIIGFFKKGAKEKEAVFERFSITKQIGTIESLLHQEKKSTDETEWSIRYTTFLEEKWIKNPNFFSALRYFKGDGRWFDPESPHYRTRADVSVRYGEPNADVRLSRDVGQSKAYGWIKRFKKAATAPKEGIELEEAKETEGEVSIRLVHSVSNPLVMSPAIDYSMDASLYKNGFFDISGIHDQSPHHEIYVKNSSHPAWKPLHQAESKGLEWLSSTMADYFWRVSNFK